MQVPLSLLPFDLRHTHPQKQIPRVVLIEELGIVAEAKLSPATFRRLLFENHIHRRSYRSTAVGAIK